MTITRIGVEGGTGTGGQHLPFARAAGADGWLFVSGQTPMVNGEVVGHGIVEQSHQTIKNLLAILAEAGYGEITTEILDAPEFYFAEDYHQQYLAKNPGGYCGLGGTGVTCPIGVA